MQSDIQERFEVLGFHILVVDTYITTRHATDKKLVPNENLPGKRV